MSSAPVEAYARCRNLLWEISTRDGRPEPGRYCRNRLGIVQALDCPVFQGLTCILEDPRADEEEPRVPGEDEIEAVRAELSVDYLRWPYWRLLKVLRGEAPESAEQDAPEGAEPPEPEASEEGDEEDFEVLRAPVAPPEEEALKEKYPGQRRSEDRLRARHPERADGSSDPFSAGIFDDPLIDEEEAPPAEVEEPAPAPEPTEAPADEKTPEEKPKKKGGGRRRRRRRPRGRRRGQSGGEAGPKTSE